MMQIVIEISEEDYKQIKSYGKDSTSYRISLNLYDAVKNGTPLPKHHGRLIDADKLELDDGYSNYDGYYHKYSRSQICNAPTVLEAEEKADANSVGLVCDIFDKMNRDEQIKVWQYVNEIMEGE